MADIQGGQHWWEETSIYQIYPRSFYDSNGDGIGDIPGIIAKLDYIRDLGFETIWISPVYASPQKDIGYDISDYCSISPDYGTMDDARTLVDEVHGRGMRVIFDMVMNHTSDEHPWFLESRSNRDNPKRDWYIWREGRGTRPPNNWKAIIGGSGWVFDKKTGQWFFHNFLPFQPDLNYRNPAVKKAMFDAVRFWLDFGVDGFRLDIFHAIFKDSEFRDNPFSFHFLPREDGSEGYFQKLVYNLNQPENFDLARELRSVIDDYSPERFVVGEVFGKTHVRRYLGEDRDGLNLILLFDLIDLKKITAGALKEILRCNETAYQAPFVPTYALGNHDRRRVISRHGGDPRMAKLLALFQYTVRGIPINYYGDEIGIPDGYFRLKGSKDSIAWPYWWMPRWLPRVLGVYINRDGCRTPMQWDGSANAGFCGGAAEPWLPVHEDYGAVNVQGESNDPASLLNAHKRLLHLRKERPALRRGSIELIENVTMPKTVVAYLRRYRQESITVFMNVSKKRVSCAIPVQAAAVLFKTDGTVTLRDGVISLGPCSGAVLG